MFQGLSSQYDNYVGSEEWSLESTYRKEIHLALLGIFGQNDEITSNKH